MGVSPAPDIAQKIMEHILASLIEEIEVYLDDIAAFLDDWESHLVLLEKLLTLLQDKGLLVNPAKWQVGYPRNQLPWTLTYARSCQALVQEN